jgi:3-deoxy-7-phosphoheptulonate synthase
MSEVLDVRDVKAAAEQLDALWVGTRNMTNTALLKEMGEVRIPVMVKRSFSAPIEDLLKAAEFVLVHGNPNVLICERGIQSCETYTRYTLDLAGVAALRELTHLPIVVDPSHATGRPSLIPTMSLAAVVAGADAIMVETHVRPHEMIRPGDGPQALTPKQLEDLVRSVHALARMLLKSNQSGVLASVGG